MDNVRLIKMSGEAIAEPVEAEVDGHSGIFSITRLRNFASQVALAMQADPSLRVAIVVGGGNIARGDDLAEMGMSRSHADAIGMLGTVLNAVALVDTFSQQGCDPVLLCGLDVPAVGQRFTPQVARAHLDKGKIVVLGGGIGTTRLTTDSAAAFRAVEVGASALLVAKFGADGVYDRNPRGTIGGSRKYKRCSWSTFFSERLSVMDLTAAAQCQTFGLRVYVFDMEAEHSVIQALSGNWEAGTEVGTEDDEWA